MRIVGLLADALEVGDAKTRLVAKAALTCLLPRLQASDAHLLNTAQRHALHKILIGMDTITARGGLRNSTMTQSRIQVRIDRSLDYYTSSEKWQEITEEQRAAILKMYEDFEAPRPEEELRLAILKALEQVGDARSLPYISDVAAGVTRTSEDLRVRRAAQECLPFLQARAEQHAAHQSLLRPTQTADPAPQTLVRPALKARESAPEELLRSVE